LRINCFTNIIILGVRNPEAARKSVESFINESLTKGKVFYEKCDTGDMESVRSFAENVQNKFPSIHLLINNGENEAKAKNNLHRI
jgi:NAD(P)-dependent dehydrogenase (short-subunit alcohol dehydrogenase family)